MANHWKSHEKPMALSQHLTSEPSTHLLHDGLKLAASAAAEGLREAPPSRVQDRLACESQAVAGQVPQALTELLLLTVLVAHHGV